MTNELEKKQISKHYWRIVTVVEKKKIRNTAYTGLAKL